MRLFTALALVLFSFFSFPAMGDISVSPMRLDLYQRNGEESRDFKVKIEASSPSEVEVELAAVEQDKRGNVSYRPLKKGEGIVLVDTGTRSLSKGEVWELTGKVNYGRSRKAFSSSLALLFTDKRKPVPGQMMNISYRYAVVLNLAGGRGRESSRPGKLLVSGVSRRGAHVVLSGSYENNSPRVGRFIGEVSLRDPATGRLIEKIPLSYGEILSRPKGDKSFSVLPGNKVEIEARLDKTRRPGSYRVSAVLYPQGGGRPISFGSTTPYLVTEEMLRPVSPKPAGHLKVFVPKQLPKTAETVLHVVNDNLEEVVLGLDPLVGPGYALEPAQASIKLDPAATTKVVYKTRLSEGVVPPADSVFVRVKVSSKISGENFPDIMVPAEFSVETDAVRIEPKAPAGDGPK